MSSYIMSYKGYWVERYEDGATVFCRGTDRYFNSADAAFEFIDALTEEA